MAEVLIDYSMNKEDKKAIFDDLAETSIGDELRLASVLAAACQCMASDANERIKAKYRKHGYKLAESPMLSGLNEDCRNIKAASYNYFNRVENHMDAVIFGADGEKKGGAAAFDNYYDDANEVCRLAMLMADRLTSAKDYAKLIADLRSRQSSGAFSEDDIERFVLRK